MNEVNVGITAPGTGSYTALRNVYTRKVLIILYLVYTVGIPTSTIDTSVRTCKVPGTMQVFDSTILPELLVAMCLQIVDPDTAEAGHRRHSIRHSQRPTP